MVAGRYRSGDGRARELSSVDARTAEEAQHKLLVFDGPRPGHFLRLTFLVDHVDLAAGGEVETEIPVAAESFTSDPGRASELHEFWTSRLRLSDSVGDLDFLQRKSERARRVFPSGVPAGCSLERWEKVFPSVELMVGSSQEGQKRDSEGAFGSGVGSPDVGGDGVASVLGGGDVDDSLGLQEQRLASRLVGTCCDGSGRCDEGIAAATIGDQDRCVSFVCVEGAADEVARESRTAIEDQLVGRCGRALARHSAVARVVEDECVGRPNFQGLDVLQNSVSLPPIPREVVDDDGFFAVREGGFEIMLESANVLSAVEAYSRVVGFGHEDSLDASRLTSIGLGEVE